ncbi:MDR family MFS transporter [Williamsia maris]|uniref:Drug resistance transporter, EmrB/QacA subfamily n=1 Tax=Williamsia maris TaxID=72806 RepID=A0ABT1HGM4_9NOCA|nr:MDR family MFS transporter [Williamsia maris]MCP2176876.1 drug resistance transporter, EmrB/QacA subfamily [Williamsia maris]
MSESTTLDAIDEDGSPTLSRRQINVIFGTIMLGMLLAALDQTIVSTALPTIVGDLGGSQHLSWVVTSYILAQTIACVVAGKFGDLFGRKRVFQVSVVIFILGSLLCGLAQDMGFLIGMRAIQGIGGGGITVTATALIGDVIPLRERGKYQGMLGAVFGVTTVIGPLLGGFFTDQLSWRWAFYVNVPIAIIVIIAAAATIPGLKGGVRPKIDYLGVVFVALGASGLTLATSWGGTQYAWGSPMIIGLFVGSVAALGVFVYVELHADEPILPMRLFTKKVFTIASILSFIVGFAMVGALTFLPSYLQYVAGASATSSGVRLLPMVVGLLITSLLSGQVVGRTGRYKIFPIAGTVIMAVALYLLSTMDQTTSTLVQSLYMLILGAGIGLAMQVLTIVVQNTSDYRDLGSATSGVTFFRTLGSSFGASIMGTVYANRLDSVLPKALAEAGVSPSAVSDPTALHRLPEAQQTPIIAAYAEALHTPFLAVVPIAVIGLLLALVLPQVKLRGTSGDAVKSAGEGFAMPVSQTSDEQLETIVGRIVANTSDATEQVLARSGTDIDPATAWGLIGIRIRTRVLDIPARQDDAEDRLGIPHGVLTSYYDDLVDAGLIVRTDNAFAFTELGARTMDAIGDAWRDWLLEQLREWLPAEDEVELAARARGAVQRSARRAMAEQQKEIVRA